MQKRTHTIHNTQANAQFIRLRIYTVEHMSYGCLRTGQRVIEKEGESKELVGETVRTRARGEFL